MLTFVDHFVLFVEKNNRVKGLILGAGRDILLGQSIQKPFQFLFTRSMRWKPFEVVAISPEPGAVTPLCAERKMFPPNHFRKSCDRFIGVHSIIVIYEQPVVY
jgi:hypothetical protein